MLPGSSQTTASYCRVVDIVNVSDDSPLARHLNTADKYNRIGTA